VTGEIAGHHGGTGRHGFEHRQWQSLPEGREDRDVECLQQLGGIRAESTEGDCRAEPGGSGGLLGSGAQRTVPRHDEADVGTARREPGRHRDERERILLLDEPRQQADARRAGGKAEFGAAVRRVLEALDRDAIGHHHEVLRRNAEAACGGEVPLGQAHGAARGRDDEALGAHGHSAQQTGEPPVEGEGMPGVDDRVRPAAKRERAEEARARAVQVDEIVRQETERAGELERSGEAQGADGMHAGARLAQSLERRTRSPEHHGARVTARAETPHQVDQMLRAAAHVQGGDHVEHAPAPARVRRHRARPAGIESTGRGVVSARWRRGTRGPRS